MIMKTKIRKIYAVLFLLLMLTEIYIALFVTNVFVRSYLGDVFITLLICFFVQALFRKRIHFLSIYVFVFSVIVEVCQYFDVVKLLNLDGCKFISVWFGRYFSFYDIICYAAGCIIYAIIDFTLSKALKLKS